MGSIICHMLSLSLSLSLLDGHYVTLLLQRIGASDWRRGFNSIFRWSFRSLQSPNVRQLEFELTWVSVCAFPLIGGLTRGTSDWVRAGGNALTQTAYVRSFLLRPLLRA